MATHLQLPACLYYSGVLICQFLLENTKCMYFNVIQQESKWTNKNSTVILKFPVKSIEHRIEEKRNQLKNPDPDHIFLRYSRVDLLYLTVMLLKVRPGLTCEIINWSLLKCWSRWHLENISYGEIYLSCFSIKSFLRAQLCFSLLWEANWEQVSELQKGVVYCDLWVSWLVKLSRPQILKSKSDNRRWNVYLLFNSHLLEVIVMVFMMSRQGKFNEAINKLKKKIL